MYSFVYCRCVSMCVCRYDMPGSGRVLLGWLGAGSRWSNLSVHLGWLVCRLLCSHCRRISARWSTQSPTHTGHTGVQLLIDNHTTVLTSVTHERHAVTLESTTTGIVHDYNSLQLNCLTSLQLHEYCKKKLNRLKHLLRTTEATSHNYTHTHTHV